MRGKIKKAMVLAAGYGIRLLPLTEKTPKPLVPVAGKPMMEYALDKLIAYGIEEVVVNVSHHKGQLMDYLSAFKSLSFKISEEAEPLETGGGLKKAEKFFGDEPLFTINSDIIWLDENESALERLTEFWDDAKMDFLLLAQSKTKAVGHDKGEDHLFIKRENTFDWDEADAAYIIAGIGIFHPRVLRNAPDGKFSVKILWREAMKQNRLKCLPHLGRWFQTGTIADIKNTEEIFVKNGVSPSQI
jgi:N-acetyl-alpha-D-muramate 1-phosphate uridylyltransferase